MVKFGNGAGTFRTSEKNIGIKSYLIGIELKQLLDDAIFWQENNTYDSEKLAIRFKLQKNRRGIFKN